MKQTLTTHDIATALHSDEYGGWSWAGALALAEYLEEYEEDCGEELELDVVAIRCDYSEYKSLSEWIDGYWGNTDHWAGMGIDPEGTVDQDEKDDLIREYIRDHGQLVEFDGGVIVSAF
jgi:hypothetical protein